MKGRALLIASLCLVLCSAIPWQQAQAEPVSLVPDLQPLTTWFGNLLSFFGLPSGELPDPGAIPLGEPGNPPVLEGGYIIEPNGLTILGPKPSQKIEVSYLGESTG